MSALCRRVPAFPLESGEALLAETGVRLANEDPLSPEALDGLFSTMATIRRHIHAHPEPGYEEKGTHALLRKLLAELAGIDPAEMRTCASTGLVVDIKGTGPPVSGTGVRTVALRADMDALRMTELNNGLPYRSQNEGVAHLCGHDGHMATLVGAATLLSKRKHKLPSNTKVRLLFQPAEEGPGGAAPMIADGCLEGVDECYGYHNWPSFKLGRMHIKAGPLMAHPSTFTIVVTGKGGHGSQPQHAVDPVLTASHLVVALQSIVSRNVASSEQAVVTVTMIHGGEVFNVIPDQVTLKGTIRDLSPTVCATIYERMRQIVSGVCATYGATGTVEFDSMYPVIDNHAEQTEVVSKLGRRLLGEDAVRSEGLPMMGAEDFSYFLQKVPGAFFFLGGNEASLNGWARGGDAAGQRSNCMCHNTAFDFNDNVSPLAAVIFTRLVEERLGVNVYGEDELPVPMLKGLCAEDVGDDGTAMSHAASNVANGPIKLPPAKKPRAK